MQRKKILSCAMAAIMAMQGGGVIFAGQENSKMQIGNKIVMNKDYELHIDKMTTEQKEFMAKLQKMFGEFELKDGKLSLKSSTDDLRKKFDLNEFDINILNEIINMQKTQGSKNVYIDDWKVYFDNEDLKNYLYAAAAMGPVALLAAFNSAAILIGGIAGTALAGIADWLAIAGEISMGAICYKITYCTLMGKGFYIGIDWSVPAPVFGEF